LGSECVSLETWDDGARRLLTLKTSRRRLGGQPAVEPHRPLCTPHSSRCRLQVYICEAHDADDVQAHHKLLHLLEMTCPQLE